MVFGLAPHRQKSAVGTRLCQTRVFNPLLMWFYRRYYRLTFFLDHDGAVCQAHHLYETLTAFLIDKHETSLGAISHWLQTIRVLRKEKKMEKNSKHKECTI